jgi:hypothetical protein
MNKSKTNSTAIFLAATLVAGIFALISPSFIDVEASGDQRDNKHKDNRHDSSKGSSVNVKFICNNINVGGVNVDVNPRDIVSSLAGAQAQEEGNQEVSANSMGNNERNHEMGNNERNHESIKQHDGKDFTFICVQNNNVPPVVLSDCEECFETTNEGGFVPPGQLTNLIEFLDETFNGATLADLCRAIELGLITEDQLEDLLNAALPGNQQRLVGLLLDCLSEFFPIEENDLTENTPLTLTP